MLLAAIPLFYVFYTHQRNKLAEGKEPLINMRLFHYKDFRIGLWASLFYFLVQESYFLITGVFFQNGLGIPSYTTGSYFVFQGIGYVMASILSVKLVPSLGKKVLVAGVLIMICAFVLHILFLDNPQAGLFAFAGILLLYGIGCGAVLPSLLAFSLKGIPHEFAGAASGSYYTAQQSAIAMGAGIVGGVFFCFTGDNPSLQEYITAYRAAAILSIAMLIIVIGFLLILPDSHTGTARKVREVKTVA